MSTTKFSDSDKKFLRSAGIRADNTSLDADRMALAQRIAKHTAPVQVSVAPDAARFALVRLALELLAAAEE